MNKKLLFFTLILFSTHAVYPMIQPYDKRKTLKINFNTAKATEAMTAIGKKPFQQAQDLLEAMDSNKRKAAFFQCSPSQKQIIFLLLAPTEDSDKIIDDICHHDTAMKEKFCSQPLGKALEWLALMQEKYKNEKNGLARVISFPELYILSPLTIIESANMAKHFKMNPNIPYEISSQQEKALSCLTDALKNDDYFTAKKFLPVFNSYKTFILDDYKNPKTHMTVLAGCVIVTPLLYLEGYLFDGTIVPLKVIIKTFSTTISLIYIALLPAISSFDYQEQKNKHRLHTRYYKTINQLGK